MDVKVRVILAATQLIILLSTYGILSCPRYHLIENDLLLLAFDVWNRIR